jgi:protein-L-isoaspartate O-methyltransferase
MQENHGLIFEHCAIAAWTRQALTLAFARWREKEALTSKRPGMRVLDIGCGAGDVSMLVADAVGESGTVVGIDREQRWCAVTYQVFLPLIEKLGLTHSEVGEPATLYERMLAEARAVRTQYVSAPMVSAWARRE